jgi:hypothetical protein
MERADAEASPSPPARVALVLTILSHGLDVRAQIPALRGSR